MEKAGYRRCEYCEEWYSETDGSGTLGQYCCDWCAERCGEVECYRCNIWHEDNSDFIVISGVEYCSTDCAESDGALLCPECDNWHYGFNDKCRDCMEAEEIEAELEAERRAS